MGIRVLGTGSYVPEKVLTNQDLEKMMDTSDEWIRQRTGIVERRVAAPDQACSDLALPASRAALEAAGLTPEQLDLIIMCTVTPDYHCPAASNMLQAKLGAPYGMMSFDVTAACSGFVFGLNVAEQYLKAGTAKRVLVVASEVMTRVIDYTDRVSAILWGDGAGAVVLTWADEDPQILSTHIHTDGANGQNLLMPGGGSKTTPISHESVDKKLHNLRLIEAANSVKVAVRRFVDSCTEACQTNSLKIEDIALFIPHQANLRMLQSVAQRLGVPMERLYITIHKYGNISSASAAIALDEAVRSGAIKKGDYVVLTAFGGGLTWGSALVRW
jgi:3-oxoacyl-[acyl-carrier-protein] synthase-3